MSANPNLWKSIAVSAIIIAVVLGGILAYAEVTVGNLNNDKNNLQSNYDVLKTRDDANVAKIDSLNSNINNLNTQISSLQAQQTANLAEIAHLQEELSANYTLLRSLEASNIIVLYHYTHSDPFCLFGFCTVGSATLQDFAYANTGTEAATNVILVLTFHDSADVPLCTITQTLAMSAQGDSIDGQTNVGTTCNWSSALSLDTALTTAKVTWS